MAQQENKTSPGIDLDTGEIRFDYIKSNHFRVIHVDGIFGGIRPDSDSIFMGVWNERWPIPKQVVFEFDRSSGMGPEKYRLGRDSVIREMEVGLVMNMKMAKSFKVWLEDKIEKHEERMKTKTSSNDK
ncbi:MAG: hypothetical protein KJ621_08870 [Proteobacteria bacterium]|nr:hypothetical protein [Pseudomonadota bacterium]